MQINQSFKNKIASAFYDKDVVAKTITKSTDSEGFVSRGTLTKRADIKANAQFAKKDWIIKEFGVDVEGELVITTDELVSEGEAVTYDGKDYEVVRSLKRDSHYLLLCKTWQQ